MKYILLSIRPDLESLLRCLTKGHNGYKFIIIFNENEKDNLIETLFKGHIEDTYLLKDRISYLSKTARIYIIDYNKSTREVLLSYQDKIYNNLYLGAQDLSFIDSDMNLLFHSVTHENLWYIRDELYEYTKGIFTPVIKGKKIFSLDQVWKLRS